MTSLTPQALAEYTTSVEQPVRLRETAAAQDILRYGAGVGSVIQLYPCLDRAMQQARLHISSSEKNGTSVADGTVILATSLNASKGRFDRVWHAPPGGLWGCLILADTFLPAFRHFLSFIPGIACCEALIQEGAVSAEIRWVNDVLAAGKKQAGFLIEGFRSPMHGEDYHLLGFGINVNNNSFPAELQESAGSLAGELGRSVNLHTFALSFLAKLRWYVGLLVFEEREWLARGGGEAYEDEHPLLRRWKELADTLGKDVVFGYDVLSSPQYQARAVELACDGALVLRHADGTTSTEHSGEIRYVENSHIA